MRDGVIETDYLVVGAGASAMAFVDALTSEGDAEVVLVDRRHDPGGHWNDAYSFVRLHQPSANYGVNSRFLGTDSIDTSGPNAGYYERARGVEIRAYYRTVLDGWLPSGQVSFYGGHEYVAGGPGEHTLVSRLTGRTVPVRVRRKLVDATCLETSVPATHTPGFTVDPEATVVPVGELVGLAEAPGGYTILGAGKTAMDACTWLLENGVDPDRIRWVRPRDSWLIDRGSVQPGELVAATMEGFAVAVESVAQASTLDDLFRRLESSGLLFRLDPAVAPTMFRGATLSEVERDALRQIEQVARLGRVRHVGSDRIVLDHGEVPTSRDTVHVDCTAYGFANAPARPIFEPDRITLQSVTSGFITFNSALLGYIETARDEVAEQNRLCEPGVQPSRAEDWLDMMCGSHERVRRLTAESDVRAWLDRSRLYLTRGLRNHLGDPRMRSAMTRFSTNLEPALANIKPLLATARPPG
ncbi:NAD(P)-binding protein [Nocardioides speluncae]|uniref:NAD(P)-binding protein n=1 Tax=Nocardioides speluncae TaxID=2670337 RepID=UPI000D69607F|nr:NAD(P)-binding protein [Nocardioides speluncae]